MISLSPPPHRRRRFRAAAGAALVGMVVAAVLTATGSGATASAQDTATTTTVAATTPDAPESAPEAETTVERDAPPAPDTEEISVTADRSDLTAEVPLETDPHSLSSISPIMLTDAVMVGLQWEGQAPATMEIRSRSGSGEWSPWISVEPTESAPDGSNPPANSEPVWVGADGDAVQFRVTAPGVAAIRAAFIDAGPPGPTEGATAGDGDGIDASPTGFTTDNGLTVHRRSQWNTGGCRASGAKVSHSDVEFASVHHTVGSNGYSAADVPAIIRGICSYHVNTQGWSDIGYNFLIDRFGGVWEGRKGGAEFPVQGAHSMGFNSWSSGFALMGDHNAVQPSAAALDSLEKIIAWKLWIEKIPATGTVTVKSYGSYKWPEGTNVTLNRISGHRDVQSTSCPGTLAYDDLWSIRSGVAAELASLPRRTVTKKSDFILWDKGDRSLTFQKNDVVGPLKSKFLSKKWKIIATPDVDGDGDDELLLYRKSDGRAKLHELTTTGRLGTKLRTYSWGKNIKIIATPDRDGDGDDELFVYRSNGSASLYELNGDGTLGTEIRKYTLATTWKAIATPDRDGDGDDELLVLRTTGGATLYEFNSSGTFGTRVKKYSWPGKWKQLAAPDIDGDGDDELLVYRNNGKGTVYELQASGKLGNQVGAPSLPNDRDIAVPVELK